MDYPLFLIENPLDLCLEANKPSPSRHLRAWASSSTGRAFGMAIADTILDELTPGDFAVYIFALLSYYRNRHATKVFVPARDQEDYLSELTRFDMVDIEANGMVLERVAREGDSDNETVFEDINSIAGISVGSESLSSSTKDCSLKTACY
ncbi:hypothetical protein NPX13_g8619 [Xylaria arbuscula]|uniref:Uncharacterized protein n=1 Tax=Xylaria arbuscula TaxID=114810 RepID=A0A9W8N8C3_9PEZI|nr:hypothetical protein NPX13_g8619 [Xylaria arbuscula]